MVGPEEFSNYDAMTPVALGFLAKYEDAVQAMECQLDATGGANAKPIVDYPGNAVAEPATGAFRGTRPASYISYKKRVLAYDMNRSAGTAYYRKPRGSWNI